MHSTYGCYICMVHNYLWSINIMHKYKWHIHWVHTNGTSLWHFHIIGAYTYVVHTYGAYIYSTYICIILQVFECQIHHIMLYTCVAPCIRGQYITLHTWWNLYVESTTRYVVNHVAIYVSICVFISLPSQLFIRVFMFSA